ncbi:hypothetical protein J4468_03540 [Candidatus Woesearchaeota archaeon]|nr:hypothetical protein [Candidatus Woesearchaeota archaeon]
MKLLILLIMLVILPLVTAETGWDYQNKTIIEVYQKPLPMTNLISILVTIGTIILIVKSF